MEITVHGELKYIPVSTVTLLNEGKGVTYPFHCPACGNTINIIGGKVTKIYPILEPSYQIPVITPCKSCKAKYLFQDSEESIDPIKVILKPSSSIQSFYCYLGGGEFKSMNKILEYNNESIYSYEYMGNVKLPFVSHCTNPDCSLIYQFI